SASDPACPINRTVRRCRNTGDRWVRVHSTACCATRKQSSGAAPSAEKYASPLRSRYDASIHPGGVRTLMPSPLSSQTSSSGIGKPWCAQCSAVFTAPVRSEEHTSELQSRENLVCHLVLEKKNLI